MEFLDGFASGFAPIEPLNENRSIIDFGLDFWGLGMSWEIYPLPGDFNV